MNFIVKKQCFGPSRLGLLSFDSTAIEHIPKTDRQFWTPLCLQYTINGSVPHIVSEMLEDLNDDSSPLLLPLPTTLLMNESLRNFNAKSESKSGIVKFIGLKKWRPTIVSIHDPLLSIRTLQNSVEGIGLYCRGGKQTVNSSKLIDVLTNFRPNVYQALCDSDTPLDASNKRISKSVERSVYLIEECLNKQEDSDVLNCGKVSVLATIEGGFNLKARMKSIKETVPKAVDGFVIDGFHSYGEQTAEKFNYDSVKPILSNITENLPIDKPRVIFGALTPTLIIKLISNGIDVFDSSYATVMSEKGMALQKILDMKQITVSNMFIDLNSKEYKEDFGPLEDNCQCYSCSNNFSRAYVNHLLNASEMLAKTLLMFHNLHVFYEFFRNTRQLLQEDKFEQLVIKL